MSSGRGWITNAQQPGRQTETGQWHGEKHPHLIHVDADKKTEDGRLAFWWPDCVLFKGRPEDTKLPSKWYVHIRTSSGCTGPFEKRGEAQSYYENAFLDLGQSEDRVNERAEIEGELDSEVHKEAMEQEARDVDEAVWEPSLKGLPDSRPDQAESLPDPHSLRHHTLKVGDKVRWRHRNVEVVNLDLTEDRWEKHGHSVKECRWSTVKDGRIIVTVAWGKGEWWAYGDQVEPVQTNNTNNKENSDVDK